MGTYDPIYERDVFWTADGRFLWWLEPGRNRSARFSTFRVHEYYGWDLVVADVETGAYDVVATDVGCVRQATSSLQQRFLATPNDTKEFCEKLIKLFKYKNKSKLVEKKKK